MAKSSLACIQPEQPFGLTAGDSLSLGRKKKVKGAVFACLLLLAMTFAGISQTSLSANPSWGITSDATYYYVESANMKIYIRKSDGLMQYFVGGKSWTSTKGYGGISITKKGVGYNDGAAAPYDIGLTPFPHSLTQLSLNTTHLSYKQQKAAGATMRLYVDVQAKAESIQVLFKIENLDSVVRGYTLSFSMWIFQNGMKQVFPYNSILEQARATYSQKNVFNGETISRNYAISSIGNISYSVGMTQSPYHNAQLKYLGVLDDAFRQTFYYGYESLRAMPNQNTTQVGIITYAVDGNNYCALNKMPSVLSTYISTITLDKEFWAIFGTPITLANITTGYLNELKARNIINIELQFCTGNYITNRNWTLTNAQIQSLITTLRNAGFKPWFYITTNFEARRTDAKNKYFDALIKTSLQQNASDDYVVLNPDPAYSWGKQILSDVDHILATFTDIYGFFVDDFGYYGDRLDYNANHSPKYYDPNTSTRNATSLSFGITNLVAQLKTRGKPLMVNSPTHIEEMYGADGALIWDFPIGSGTALYLHYSTLHWGLPSGFIKSGISSNVGNSHDSNNTLCYRMNFWINGQPYVYGYKDADDTVFNAAKTEYHIQNAWFLEQPAEYAYGNGITLKIQNSDTRLAIFGQSATATITSSTPIDIYTKDGTLIGSEKTSQSLNAYLTGTQDIFVIKFTQSNPYIIMSQSCKVSNEAYTGKKLVFTVRASSESTSTTKVYCGSLRKPKRIDGISDSGAWTYDGSSIICTITTVHSSDANITIYWRRKASGKYELDVFILKGSLRTIASVTVNSENKSTSLFTPTS